MSELQQSFALIVGQDQTHMLGEAYEQKDNKWEEKEGRQEWKYQEEHEEGELEKGRRL